MTDIEPFEPADRLDDPPPWWPTGARLDFVRECNCDVCEAMLAALEKDGSGQAMQINLTAYSGEVAAND